MQMHQFQGHAPIVVNTEVSDKLDYAMEQELEYSSEADSDKEQTQVITHDQVTPQVNNISHQNYQHHNKKDCDICGGIYG